MSVRRMICVCGLSLLAASCSDKGGASATPGTSAPKGAPKAVVLTKAAIARNGVVLGKVSQELLVGGLRVPAEIKLDHHRTAHVTAIVSGQIQELKAARGAMVKKGDVMALLHSATLGNARADIAAARATLANAKASLERQKRLKAEGIGATKNLLAAQAVFARANAQLGAARARISVYGAGRGGGASSAVRAPMDGQVIACRSNRGELVKPGEHIYVISDLSHVWVIGRVYEQDIAAVKKGLPAVVTLAAYPERSWRGTIGHVDATLDEKTRTLGIRVELANPDRLLKPGLFGSISLSPAGKAAEKALVVPSGALQRIDGRATVFVPEGKAGRFAVRRVRVGRRVGKKVEILSGLSAGAELVISGTFTLKSELLRSQLAAE